MIPRGSIRRIICIFYLLSIETPAAETPATETQAAETPAALSNPTAHTLTQPPLITLIDRPTRIYSLVEPVSIARFYPFLSSK